MSAEAVNSPAPSSTPANNVSSSDMAGAQGSSISRDFDWLRYLSAWWHVSTTSPDVPPEQPMPMTYAEVMAHAPQRRWRGYPDELDDEDSSGDEGYSFNGPPQSPGDEAAANTVEKEQLGVGESKDAANRRCVDDD